MKRILVVDDDRTARLLMSDILRLEGFEILEAEDGQVALKLLDTEKVDLIITDRSMPGMGGMDLLRALKERKSIIPTIVVSAFGEESLWGEAIGLGAQEYMLKPFAAADVVKLVKKCLAGARRPK